MSILQRNVNVCATCQHLRKMQL
ncbi:hypothetical protein [Microbulbifer aggregans]